VRRQPTLEKGVVARIVADLRTIPWLVIRNAMAPSWAWPVTRICTGTYRGAHFEMEVKRPNDPTSQLTKLQIERLAEWKRGGAITGVGGGSRDARILLGLTQVPAPVGGVDLRRLPEVPVRECRSSGALPDLFRRRVRAGGQAMTPPTARDIDEALRAFVDATPAELSQFTVATAQSPQFVGDVMAALKLIADGTCLTEAIWASMIVMLWAGMAIERKRQEVEVLERIYGGDAA
jgi:hypothetical protein